jgi:hypothetical protein
MHDPHCEAQQKVESRRSAIVMNVAKQPFAILLRNRNDTKSPFAFKSHDAILGLYRQRFDIQVGVAGLEQILGLWKPG